MAEELDESGDFERRTTTSPTLGAKICLLLAALTLVPAVFYLVSPVQVTAGNGNAFYCGSAVSGPKNQFARGICGKANTLSTTKAVAFGAAAVIFAVGGFVVFGTERREQLRRKRPALDDDEVDDPADDDHPSRLT